MKPLALPLLLALAGASGANLWADEPNLGAPVTFETGLLSLGTRDSLVILAREAGEGTSQMVVQVFGEQDQVLVHTSVPVAPGAPGKVTVPYAALGTNLPLPSVWARIKLTEEFPPTSGLISASTVYLTVQVAHQPAGGVLSATLYGSCTSAGPRVHGGGRDSMCVGPIDIPDEAGVQ